MEGVAFLEEFRAAGFRQVEVAGRRPNPRSGNRLVEVTEVRAVR